MSLQNKLEGLFNKGKAKFDEYTAKHQNPTQQQQYQPQSSYQNQNHNPTQQQQYQPQSSYQNQNHNPPQQQQYQHQSSYQNQNHNPSLPPPPLPQRPGPPPVNYASKPGSYKPAGPAEYWRANFKPHIPIYELFQQETGSHGWGNAESQNYTNDPSNAFFTPDNKLVLRGIVNNSLPPGQSHTSARLVSAQALSRPRGYVSATLTAPSAQGIWPAFWLLPSNVNWPTDGEVDIFESWNGDNINHSCLHWGHFNGPDSQKHRVLETPIPSMPHTPHTFSFAWDENEGAQGERGRMVWYIDGRSVMRGLIPAGTRPMKDYRIMLNVAMGGNVCGGQMPKDGTYDFVVHELKMCDEPVGGWEKFGRDFERAKDGKTM